MSSDESDHLAQVRKEMFSTEKQLRRQAEEMARPHREARLGRETLEQLRRIGIPDADKE